MAMKYISHICFLCLCVTYFSPLELLAQGSTITHVSLVNNPIPHDVPVSLKGVNQTAHTTLDYVYNLDFLSEFTEIHPGTMRFPGGTFANSYDWEASLNNSNQLNLRNAIELANLVGSEINYVINYGTTTPEEAAELVRLLNDTAASYVTQRENYFGVSEPVGVKYWELGNELAAKWEWHVSWVAGGGGQQIFFSTGETSLDMPRSTTDSLHYYGGDIWREGWVYRWGDGMTVYNSILGSLHKVTDTDEVDNEATVDIEFGPILSNEVVVWYVSDPTLASVDYNDLCDNAVTSPCHDVQQDLYDVITSPSNLLSPSEYTISSDGNTVTVHPVTQLLENTLILVEYKTHHAGAFDIRDAMKEADPSIEIGYCIDFRQNLIDTPGFKDDLTASPPDFMIYHPYNNNTDLALNNGYLSEIIHLVDDKISNEYIPNEAELDSLCSELGIPEIGIGLTEWNIRLCADGDCNPAYNGILGGLYTANFYSQFYQAQADGILDVRLSNHFAGVASGLNLIHMWHFNNNTLQSTPQSESTRMVNDVLGAQTIISNDLLIDDNPIIEIIILSIDDYGNNVITTSYDEALKIYANDDLDSNTLEFLILNNDDESNHQIEFQLPCDRVSSVATLEVLIGDTSPGLYAINTSSIDITPGSGVYSINAPSFSVCTLKIPYTSSSSSCPCFADFNENGTVETVDFLDLLSEFGCNFNCNYDLNANSSVTTEDIIIFLALFGEVCL